MGPLGEAIRRHPKGRSVSGFVFEIVFEFLFEFFELKESSQAPRIPHPSSDLINFDRSYSR